MDITHEKDLTKLKAMAYDEVVRLEVAQNNLQAIQTRIAQVEAEPVEEDIENDNNS